MTDILEGYRNEIDEIDLQIIPLLGRRFEIARQVALHKSQNDIPRKQTGRRQQVLDRARTLGAEHGLEPEFMHALYMQIIEETCRVEDEIIARTKSQV